MKYGSVCSGVEAATVAWEGLGFEPQWFSEIEKFPSAVLQHHYPDVPNLGDMTKFKEWKDAGSIDLLVGGTPCQSYSVAGLRKGLADPRGNLMLTYLAIAAQYRPKWLVWENVPGVLSSNRGRDFGTFLGALGQLRYGFAYRMLDAQYFGVAQRRKRVFVVGYLGDWRRAAAVLFERESLSGHPAPRREERQETAGTVTTRAGNGGGGGLGTDEACSGYLQAIGNVQDGSVTTLSSREYKGLSCGRDGMTSAAVIAFGAQNSSAQGLSASEHITPTLDKSKTPALAFSSKQQSMKTSDNLANTLGANDYKEPQAVADNMQVRRLTPKECERLQGFPDSYTQIPYRNKPAENCPDGPRYKAMGNSMAVPVMRWIGKRIKMVDEL